MSNTSYKSWRDPKELEISLKQVLDPTYDPLDEERGNTGWGTHILDEIMKLLEGTFNFNVNPLPQLRKIFPELVWSFHFIDWEKSDAEAKLMRMIKNADLFWPAADASGAHHWITATRKGTTHPLSICGCRNLEFYEHWKRQSGEESLTLLRLYEQTQRMYP